MLSTRDILIEPDDGPHNSDGLLLHGNTPFVDVLLSDIISEEALDTSELARAAAAVAPTAWPQE